MGEVGPRVVAQAEKHAGVVSVVSSVPSASRPAAPLGKKWIAYTDGACTGNPGPAGAGFIVIAPDGKIREGFENLGVGTNNIAELTGVLRAVEGVPNDGVPLVVHTDSKYAIGVLTKGWKAKANQELIAKIKRALSLRPNVSMVYVPGHAGVPLNERADELAREAVRTGRSRPLPAAAAEAAEAASSSPTDGI